MSDVKISKTECNAILDQAERLLEDAVQMLTKSHEGEQSPGEIKPDVSASAPASEEKSASASESSGVPEKSASGSEGSGSVPEEKNPVDAEASASSSEDGGEMHVDPEAVKAEIMKLGLDDAKKVFMAVKEAMIALMGQDPDAAPADPAPPAAPPVAPPASPSAPPVPPPASPSAPPVPPPAPPVMDDMAHKAEIKSEGCGGQIKKAEDEEIASLKKTVEEQNTVIDQLVKAVKMVVERPERKAVTSVAYMAKSEPSPEITLSRPEIIQKLNDVIVAKSETLSVSDRDAIRGYCAGHVPATQIAHLVNK